MKAYLIFFSLILCLSKSHSNAQTLPMNASGKIEFVEIVEDSSLTKIQLFSKADLWSQSLHTPSEKSISTTSDPLEGKLTTHYKFLFYTQSGIFKKVSGAVTYTITVEVKDFKYRYTFTDFVYHPYAQNRNYQMVDTGREKKLEDPKASGYQKTWKECKVTTANKVNAQINSLKQSMIQIIPPPAQIVEAKKSDW